MARTQNSFVIYKADDGQYCLVLKGGNAAVVMTSRTYPRRALADGIRAVRNISANASVIDMA
jgi:uncharacterized protein YegP (UPF0339 family)